MVVTFKILKQIMKVIFFLSKSGQVILMLLLLFNIFPPVSAYLDNLEQLYQCNIYVD